MEDAREEAVRLTCGSHSGPSSALFIPQGGSQSTSDVTKVDWEAKVSAMSTVVPVPSLNSRHRMNFHYCLYCG